MTTSTSQESPIQATAPCSFDELGLAPELLKAILASGYTTPTPIQAQAIPLIISGKDIMGGAQTGTGKTAAFTLPILHRILPFASSSPSPAKHPVRALILAPTRELAMQVFESVRTYSQFTSLRAMCAYGGVDIKPQIAELKRGVEILVATPGRLLDHIEHKSVSFSAVQALVLDEADRMLDMGFIPDVTRILKLLPQQRQSLLFSATFSDEIKKLADSMLHQPILIEVARRNQVSDTITHRVHPVSEYHKRHLLIKLLKSGEVGQCIVFMRTKQGCSRLSRELQRAGIHADAIHGDKSQLERIKALDAFRSGETRTLVATDVAARGIDIDELSYVINYELPHVPEDYVHRIGRTGRAGKQGNAISLVSALEVPYLVEIEKLIKRPIEQIVVTGYEPEETYEYPPGTRRKSGHTNSNKAPAPPSRPPVNTPGNHRRNQNMIAADGFDFSKPYQASPLSVSKPKEPAPSGSGRPHAAQKPVVAALLGGLGRKD